MLQKYKAEFDLVLQKCEEDLKSVRASRSNPSLVENLIINAYNTKSPLVQLSTISTPDPKTIIIQPWDKSITKNIEDAIRISDLNLNPINEGHLIRLVIPQLTEERRKELVKTLNKKAEEFRIRIRQVRDSIKDTIIKSEKDKTISEDEKFNLLEKLDKLTGESNDKIKIIVDKKEKEIMTI